ncbi:Hypothetical Protein FCC1311_067732 [Hondaea fermentalgiana]|uniref:Uncharacterized protein n=1 Tax=Hondaea fermentalgiana TaxID=2315210 RepID=A0A2R5GPK5_9STRA|nr:Hypothetical Protein FCC1311_067732 [Hondaea fermentalgiana]|eukprot:GBG30553.1 Hypothetical Protein FCC1311_067732 [Hondaea fermentalgiana]
MRRGLTRYEAVACDPSTAYACLGPGECVPSGYCQCDSNWAVAGAQLAEGRPACNVNESFILAVRGCYVILAIIAFLLFVFSFQEALRKRKGGGLLALLTKSLPILTMHGLSATIITLWFSRDDEGHLHNYMVHKPVTAISDWGLALALVSETVFLTSFRRRVLIIVSAQGITRASVPGRALGSQRGLIVTASCIMGVFSMPLIGLSLGNQRVIRAGFCCMAIVDTYLASSTVRIMSHLAIHLRSAVSSAPSGARSTQKLRQMLWRCYLLRAVDGCVQFFTTLCHLSLGLFFETLFPFSEYIAVTVLTLGLVDAIVHSALSVLRKKNKQRRLSSGAASKRRRVTPSATAASGLSTVAASASGAALDLACDAPGDSPPASRSALHDGCASVANVAPS